MCSLPSRSNWKVPIRFSIFSNFSSFTLIWIPYPFLVLPAVSSSFPVRFRVFYKFIWTLSLTDTFSLSSLTCAFLHQINLNVLHIADIPVKFMGAYVNARIRHNGIPDKSTKQRTRVIKNTSDPVWNEELTFRIRNVYTDSISFHIYVHSSWPSEMLLNSDCD